MEQVFILIPLRCHQVFIKLRLSDLRQIKTFQFLNAFIRRHHYFDICHMILTTDPRLRQVKPTQFRAYIIMGIRIVFFIQPIFIKHPFIKSISNLLIFLI